MDEEFSISAGFMAMVGTFSCISSIFILFTIYFFKLYKSPSTRLIAYMSITDFLQSIATQISYGWISTIPETGTFACRLQGFLFNYSNVSSSFWALSISLHTVLCGLFGWSKIKFEIVSICLCVSIPFIFSISGFGIQNTTHTEFYSDVGVWCWISENFESYRFAFHYVWIFIVMILLFLIYSFIAYRIYSVKSSLENQSDQEKKWNGSLKKLSGYPIVFFFVFFPLALDRLLIAGNQTPPFGYLMFAVCIFVSNGFFNAILYGTTRKVFSRYKDYFLNKERTNLQSISTNTN